MKNCPEEFEDEYNAYSDYLKEEDPIPYRVGHADWSGTEGADILDEVREAINTAIKDIVDEIDSNIDYFIEKLVDEISDDFVGEYEAQMGADSLRNFIDNNPNAIDLDMVYEEVKNQDGRGSSLSGYDGE
jgi:gas vesicle protein